MAKATVVTPPAERVISLELTEREAAFLYYLTGWAVTGTSDGPRAHSNAIYDALTGLDLGTAAIKAARAAGDGVRFNSYLEGSK